MKIRGKESAGGEGEMRNGTEYQSGADMLWSPLLSSSLRPGLCWPLGPLRLDGGGGRWGEMGPKRDLGSIAMFLI